MDTTPQTPADERAAGDDADGSSGLSRRDALKLAACAAAVPLVARAASLETLTAPAAAAIQAAAPAAGRFFSAGELALLDELTEMILPADDHSPGARAAKVAAYVDERMAERNPAIPEHAEENRIFKEGLSAVEALSKEMNGRAFLEASPEQRLQVLEHLAAHELAPKTAPDEFFVALKRWTTDVYYSSKIGIQTEMEYKGNTLLQEFVGYEQHEKTR
jgi:hypothetical protein